MYLKYLNCNQRHPKLKINKWKFRGCFSQVQQVNLRNKKYAPPRGIYLSTQKVIIKKIPQAIYGKRKSAVKCLKK